MTDPTLQAAITAVGAGTQSPQQAAMVNAAYNNNQMPVLAPVAPSPMNADFTNLSQAQRAGAYSQEGNNLILTYDTTGLSDPRNQQGKPVYLTPAEYQAKFGRTPEQYEQTKYNIFNNPSAVDPNTIPSDLRPSYDTAMQDRVHDYFRANPSAAFLEINRQYATIKSGTVYSGGRLNWASGGMQLSDPSEEAGGPVFSGRAAKYAALWLPLQISKYGGPALPERTETVPTRDPLVSMSIAPGRDVYVPIGEMEQQLRTDAKLIVADRGAYEVWQTPKNTMPGLEGYFTRIYPMITAGGSDFALQSGMVSGKAATPWVVDEYGMTGLWKASDAARVKDIQENPELYSRLGSELYGGIVQKLNPAYPYNTIEAAWGRGQIVEPGVYPDVRENFASLVKFGDVNAPKGSVSDASDLPKFGSISPQQFAEMPALQRVDTSGDLSPAVSMATIPKPFTSVSSPATIAPGDPDYIMAASVPAGDNLPVLSPTLGFGAMAAEDGTNAVISRGDMMGLPTPFISKSEPAPNLDEYQPSGLLGLGGLLPEMPSGEQTKAYMTNQQWRSDPLGAMFKFSIDTYTAPVSTASGVASRLSSGLTDFIYKPAPIVVDTGSSRLTKTETFDLPTVITREEMDLPGSSVRSGGNQTISDLGAWLIGSRGSIDQTDKAAVDDYNKKADTFTKMQEQNPVFVTTTGGTKTIVTESGGQRIVTTETGESGKKVYATEWDRFGEGSGRFNRWVTGLPLAKQEAYFETIKSEPGLMGEAKRGLFYIGTTAVNNPAELAPAAIVGVTFSGAASMAPGFLGEVAAGTGLTAKAATFLSTPGGTSLAKAGLVGVFGGLYTYGVTDKFTATPEQTKVNIYSSVPALAAMYAGAGGLDWTTDYASARFAEKPMQVRTQTNELTYTAQPDVSVPSGVGGNMRLVSTNTVATQPSINILGREIALPRIFSPVERGTYVRTTEGYGDVGSLLDARLTGTETNPLAGSRVETLRLEEFRSQDLARGTGEVQIGEMRLPRPISEYQRMGAADARASGMSQETLTSQLMMDAARATPPTEAYRALDVSVPKGTEIRSAFDWTGRAQGGNDVALNRINFEDYFGSMKVTETGSNAYEVNVVRDAYGSETGNFEVRGSQTPENRIVAQLQEVSRNLEAGATETAFAFDKRGNLIHTESGEIGRVARNPVWDAIDNAGGGSAAHTHPAYDTGTWMDALRGGYLREKISVDWQEFRGIGNQPSKDDMGVFAKNSPEVNAEYIVSPDGVTIMREPVGGWHVWETPARLVPQFIEDYTPTDFALIKSTTGGSDFIGNIGRNEAVASRGYTERITDVSGEMRNAFPEGVRIQFSDMIDRMVLKNPNLEFIREPAPTDVVIRGGRNPYSGTPGVSYSSPLAASVQVEKPLYNYQGTLPETISKTRQNIGGQEIVRAGVPGETIRPEEPITAGRSGAMALPFRVSSTETVRAVAPVFVTALETKPSQGTRSGLDFVQAFTPASAQISGQVPAQVRRNDINFIRAFDMGSDIRRISDQRTNLDIVTAFDVKSDTITAPYQEITERQIPFFSQTPYQDIIQDQTPYQDIIQKQEITQIQTPEIVTWTEKLPVPPVPVIPIPWLPALPNLGGGGGTGASARGRGPRKLELFSFAPRKLPKWKMPKVKL